MNDTTNEGLGLLHSALPKFMPDAPISASPPCILTSAKVNELIPALLEAQMAMPSPPKNAVNPQFKNRYADLESVLDSAKPHLNKAGILLLQPVAVLEDGSVSITSLLWHKSDQWISCELTFKPDRATAQGAASVITYGRRYSLQALLAMTGELDDDAEIAMGRGKPALEKPAMEKTAIFTNKKVEIKGGLIQTAPVPPGPGYSDPNDQDAEDADFPLVSIHLARALEEAMAGKRELLTVFPLIASLPEGPDKKEALGLYAATQNKLRAQKKEKK